MLRTQATKHEGCSSHGGSAAEQEEQTGREGRTSVGSFTLALHFFIVAGRGSTLVDD